MNVNGRVIIITGAGRGLGRSMAKAILVGRLGAPEEIAQAVRFIFENDYFNGRVIEVDGGLRL